MTEKELLERISKTTIRSLISTSDPERESIVDESREQSELLSKLTAFLLAQDNVTTLLDTFLSIPTDMKVPVQLNIKQLFTCYDSRYLNPDKDANGRDIKPQHVPRLVPVNGNRFVMNIGQYEEERLEALLPVIAEEFPLYLVGVIHRHFGKIREVQNLIDAYLQEYTIAPLMQAVPEIKVAYTISDTVNFVLDISGVTDVGAIASLAQGEYRYYTITLQS